MPNRLMQFFTPITATPEQFAQLQSIRQQFIQLAASMDATLPDNAEKTVSIRNLMEAKEAAVRAVLYKEPVPTTVQEAAVEIDQSLFGVKNRYA